MKKLYEEKYHQYENNYWWFRGRRDIITRLIKNYSKNSSILEVGCSGGPLLKKLNNMNFKRIIGIDISEKAIKYCKKRGLENVYVMDGARTSFEDEQFDIIIASDILEHIKEENTVLKEWYRILKSKGTLIIFVPAFNVLWSAHDIHSKHYRRYTKKSLLNSLKNTSFKLKRLSYWNLLSFFPASIVRLYQRYSNKEHGDQLYNFNPSLNKFIIRILKFENYLLTKTNFPIGLSVFAIAAK